MIRIFRDKESLSRAFVDHVLAKAVSPLKLALSGGSTPKRAFELMAASDVDRSKLDLYMVDERYVPPTDERSNERMMRDAFGPDFSLHPMYNDGGPATAAMAYDSLLRAQVDRFDIVLLGMGDDGHTASIFPGMWPEFPSGARCVASRAPVVSSDRITLTPHTIGTARETIFMVAGSDKAEMLRRVLEGPEDFDNLPSQYVSRHSENPQWWLDEAAASLLSK